MNLEQARAVGEATAYALVLVPLFVGLGLYYIHTR